MPCLSHHLLTLLGSSYRLSVIRVDYSEFRSAEEMAGEIARQRADWPTSPTAAVKWATRETGAR